ncbi:MAG TPA: DUF4870 domain-containing protein [Blastocatellia bacterium]|nr:DUF4870 domain-containing protein [Blastocatellia bacterium]
MSNQPPYGYPGGSQGYQGGGGYPPPGPPANKTKVLNLDYNIAALLCYLPICCINLIASIIWFASEPKENRFLRFHALQSLGLIAISIVVWIVFMFLGVGMMFSPSDTVGAAGSGLLSIIQLLVWLVLLIVHILCMVKAYQGQMWKLPVIGDIAEKNA